MVGDEPVELLRLGDIAPDFSYRLPDGTTQRLSDLRDKQVILNFWATWCGPCIEEIPLLQQTAHANAGTLLVLGVNKLEEPVTIAAFAEKTGVTFPLVANLSGDISVRYGARLLPMTYFINSDGTISAIEIGALDAAKITARLKAMR